MVAVADFSVFCVCLANCRGPVRFSGFDFVIYTPLLRYDKLPTAN